MSNFEVRDIDGMHALRGGVVKLAGAELGVESLGLQVFDFPPDFADYPEHDHAEVGHEEIFAVLEGSAEFEVDGERVPIDRGRMIRLAPTARRKLWPGPEGVRILAIGATPGETYERPEALRLPSD